jgi:hypothetical protein
MQGKIPAEKIQKQDAKEKSHLFDNGTDDVKALRVNTRSDSHIFNR